MTITPIIQNNQYSTNNDSKKDTSTNNSIFQEELENTETTKEDKKQNQEEVSVEKSIRELFEDIISLLKTGFTKDELEAIQKLKEEISKKIKEELENGTADTKTIEDMMDQLEKAITALKKSVTGVAIVEADEINKKSKQNNEVTGPLKESIIKLEELSSQIKELEKLKKKEPEYLNSQEEFLLIQELKNS